MGLSTLAVVRASIHLSYYSHFPGAGTEVMVEEETPRWQYASVVVVAETRAIVCWPDYQSQGKHSLFCLYMPGNLHIKKTRN